MLTDEVRQQAADQLYQAEVERHVIPQLRKTYEGIELADAYVIQGLWLQKKIKNGARVIGRKIGLTSRAMQMAHSEQSVFASSNRKKVCYECTKDQSLHWRKRDFRRAGAGAGCFQSRDRCGDGTCCAGFKGRGWKCGANCTSRVSGVGGIAAAPPRSCPFQVSGTIASAS